MATIPFDWAEFLRLATELSARPDEASHRASMSRAYYCVYHKASERAVSTGYTDQKKHYVLWELYKSNTRDRTCRELAELGAKMHKERKDADYDPAANRIAERTTVQINRAKSFLTKLAAIGAGLPKPRIAGKTGD